MDNRRNMKIYYSSELQFEFYPVWLLTEEKTERIISTTARHLVFLSGENVQSLAQIKHFTLVACPGG